MLSWARVIIGHPKRAGESLRLRPVAVAVLLMTADAGAEGLWSRCCDVCYQGWYRRWTSLVRWLHHWLLLGRGAAAEESDEAAGLNNEPALKFASAELWAAAARLRTHTSSGSDLTSGFLQSANLTAAFAEANCS